jgi:hypothetical protein
MNQPTGNPFQDVNDRLARVIGRRREPTLEESFDRDQTPEDREWLLAMHIEVAE